SHRRMILFDRNDRKYHTCCCGVHITTLARVIVVIILVSNAIFLWRSPLGWSGFLIANIGSLLIYRLFVSSTFFQRTGRKRFRDFFLYF
ncbi:hypothetical protein PMAYCL1PPCAC_05659, partial [Pristionchus mayeri]